MPSRARVALGEVATIDTGFPFKSAQFSNTGVPLLRGDNIAPGALRMADAKRWSLGGVDERYRVREGDVVLAMDRPWIGAGLKQARVRAEDHGAYLVQRVARLRARPDQLDQGYLAAIIASPEFTNFMQSNVTGSAVPHISGSQIASFQVKLPSLPEQREIAEVLGALDDKIAANTRLATTADKLARELWRSAKKPQRVPLSDAAEFVNGRAFTKDASGTGRVVIRIAELKSGVGGSTVRSDAEVAEEHVAYPGDLLFAWSGSLTVKRWDLAEGIVNQHIFKVIPKEGWAQWAVHQLLLDKLPDYLQTAADKATTMGHIQRKHLDEEVASPSASWIAELSPAMENLYATSLSARTESHTLATTRDALLPKLMSGALRVSAVQEG